MPSIKVIINAVIIARKYCKNWISLLIKAVLRKKAIFRAKDNSMTGLVDARSLLKSLVRLHTQWDHSRGNLKISFYGDHLEYKVKTIGSPITIRLPIGLVGYLTNKVFFLREVMYGAVNYNRKTVLDIGAFIGDTALFFLSKGAKNGHSCGTSSRAFQVIM